MHRPRTFSSQKNSSLQIAAVHPIISNLRTEMGRMLQPALRDGVAREVQVSCDGGGVLLRAPQMFELHVPFLSFLGERWADGFVVPNLTPFQLLQQDDEVQEAHKVMVCVGAVVQLLERELRLEEPELVSVSRLSQGRQ